MKDLPETRNQDFRGHFDGDDALPCPGNTIQALASEFRNSLAIDPWASTGSKLSIIDRAIKTFTKESAESSPSASSFNLLLALEDSLYNCPRFTENPDVDLLNKAVDLSQTILDQMVLNGPNWSIGSKRLRVSLRLRYERLRDLNDIERAITLAGLNLYLQLDPSIDRSELVEEFYELNLSRWKFEKKVTDIESLVELQTLAGQGSITKGKYLLKLESILTEEFRATGKVEYLNWAISVGKDCVEAFIETTNGSNGFRSMALFELASRFQMRYEHEGDLNDIDQATETIERALDIQISEFPLRQSKLENLGLLWYTKYKHTDSLADLNQSIKRFEQSATLCRMDKSEHMVYYYLGVCYHARYCLTGLSNDLYHAVEMARTALRLRSEHQTVTNPGAVWFNFGSYIYQKFLFTVRIEDLETAIESFKEALKIPDLSPDERCMVLCQLGDSLVMRYGVRNEVGVEEASEDLSNAESVLREALSMPEASFIYRASAARSLANKLAHWSRWQESYTTFQDAVSLFALSNSRSTDTGKLSKNKIGKIPDIGFKYQIEAFSGVSCAAAAVALNAGKAPLEALNLMERGHGLLSDSIISTAKGSATEIGSPTNPLLICDEAEIMRAVGEDKLAVINVSKYRCDAILVEKGRIKVIPLPLLDQATIDSKTRTLRTGGEGSWGVLEWLWEVVAFPILKGFDIVIGKRSTIRNELRKLGLDMEQSEILGEEPPAEKCLPHLWWIATGPLTLLPIHAAGRHFKRSGEAVLDCVISSYAISVKSFMKTRLQAPNQKCNASRKALVIAMPKTPGHSPLSFAEKEAETVSRICKSLDFNTSSGDIPKKKEDILNQLRDCQIFHFAGHGLSDPNNPAKSFLLLEDWKKSPLTVESLQGLKLHDNPPFLAYLSACSTGLNKVMTLCDEGINLISASQLAGFRHVIGSLWEVNDRHCVSVAKIVYETIAENGLTNSAVAFGLHRASVRLRNEAVSNRAASVSPSQSKRDLSSKLTTIKPDQLEIGIQKSGSCIRIPEFPDWLRAELKSYRSNPLRQETRIHAPNIVKKILSLPVEVAMVRRVPLEMKTKREEANEANVVTNQNQDQGNCEGPMSLRTPVPTKRRKLKMPHLYWVPYVHFGI
ncbi:hypothetical protein TWF730_011272 [Orbilia blumenaviensis]|uniref:CHAT domain-containing protein n=1 Tax=Orbilia blumenaviensis TaxID=1796055 RepID=A0AAV9UPD2_9PEZI